MSSRALRKVQREKERLAKTDVSAQVGHEESEKDGDEEQEQYSPIRSKPSAFEMLGQLQDGLEEDEDNEDRDSEREHQETGDEDEKDANQDSPSEATPTQPGNAKSEKPRRKRKKRKNKPGQEEQLEAVTEDLTLSGTTDERQVAILEIRPLLSINKTHLLVYNEMKRLFGRVVYEVDREEQAARDQALRTRFASGEGFSLAEVITGKLSVAGPGLAAVLRRRNIFAQGKEDWPRQTNSGMTMEIQSTSSTGAVLYDFIWTERYLETQSEFQERAATMDPVNLLGLIRKEPYHISTLLQLSEVAKQEKDRGTNGELLERALFAFGKALHPSFESNLAQGKARLDFSKLSNREFFLTVWKWIANISQRATYRTAFEWAKLLLSLDPSGDPYCVSLILDQLALRSGQDQALLDLANSEFFNPRWVILPNIQYSCSLAQRVLDGQISEQSKALLSEAISAWPWVAVRLFQELGIEKIPLCIWGSQPRTDKDKLFTELYVKLAQDIWKSPEAKEFLVEVTTKLSNNSRRGADNLDAITRDEARLVILTDDPTLIGLLPRDITSTFDSTADPLPPGDVFVEQQTSTATAQNTSSASNGRRPYYVLPSSTELEPIMNDQPEEFVRRFWDSYDQAEAVIPGLREAADHLGEPEQDNSALGFIGLIMRLGGDRAGSSDFRRVAEFLDYMGTLLNHPLQRVAGLDGSYITIGPHLVPQGRRPGSTGIESDTNESGNMA